MPRRRSKTKRTRHHRKAKRTRHRRRSQRGGTLAYLDLPENRPPMLAVGLEPNPEGEYDNPDNLPTLRRATI